jgi:hypothetical protein
VGVLAADVCVYYQCFSAIYEHEKQNFQNPSGRLKRACTALHEIVSARNTCRGENGRVGFYQFDYTAKAAESQLLPVDPPRLFEFLSTLRNGLAHFSWTPVQTVTGVKVRFAFHPG